MEEVKKHYYSIKEVAETIGVATSCIRFWCGEFDIHAHRNANGFRKFTIEDIAKLEAVNHLINEEGFTLPGAKSKFRQMKFPISLSRVKEDVRRQLSVIYAK